jgi:hypothetical protein
MKTVIIVLFASLIMKITYSQVTPFTGGAGSGFRGNVSASISCPLFFGGAAGGKAVNTTPAIVCAMFFGGAGDGFDAAKSSCEELLTEADAGSRVAEGGRSTSLVANAQAHNANEGATSDEAVMPGSMKVFPNPASGVATLRMEVTKPVRTQIIVYRADGKLVHSFPVQLTSGVNTVPLDLSHLSGGLYIIYNSAQQDRVKMLVIGAQ